jgi:uncharacterized protein YjiS (DUF1127 family)
MFLAHLVRLARSYLKYRSTVAALADLDDRRLNDIGLTRGQIANAAWNNAHR